MMRERMVGLVSGIWAIVFFGSFLWVRLIQPTGDGFTRGLNRVSALMGWQALAVLLAIVAWGLVMGVPKPRPRRLRWVGFLPVVVSGLLVLLVALFLVYNIAAKPPAA